MHPLKPLLFILPLAATHPLPLSSQQASPILTDLHALDASTLALRTATASYTGGIPDALPSPYHPPLFSILPPISTSPGPQIRKNRPLSFYSRPRNRKRPSNRHQRPLHRPRLPFPQCRRQSTNRRLHPRRPRYRHPRCIGKPSETWPSKPLTPTS